ncbi:MAG: hypothetical protein AAFZ15_04470 [Bacteroidota bacterium]
MALLEVILGMMFIYMVLSLLGTTVNELLSSWRGWRGHFLEEGLKRLLTFEDNPAVFKKFTNNEFYKQLRQHKTPLRVSRAPEWLSSKNFVNILVNTLKNSDTVVEKADEIIADLPKDSKLRKLLEQFKSEGTEDIEAFKGRLQKWYDDVMDHSSAWYKRHLQMVTIFVGLAIAAVINADSFDIYYKLSNNATARQSLSKMAEAFVANNETLPAPKTVGDSLTLTQIRAELKNFTNSEEYAKISNVLGLGWNSADLTVSPLAWLKRVFGWFVTALAISLGAPFWFSALKKVVSIRSSSSESSSSPSVVINTGEKKTTA